jgi:hypothetical protein
MVTMHATARARCAAACVLPAALALAGCAATGPRPDAKAASAAAGPMPSADPQMLQSVVMSMSDDWNTALGESMISIQSTPGIDASARMNSLAFLRNGMGASLDIAVGPNPRVAMLDLLVLATLQTWALEHTWAGNGIPGNLVGPAKERLAEARGEMTSPRRSSAHAEGFRGSVTGGISAAGSTDRAPIAFAV